MKLIFVVLFLCCAALVRAQEKTVAPTETAKGNLSYGIVADNSGSYRLLLEKVIGTIKQIAESNSPGDETFLVRFVDSEKISIAQNFTDQPDLIGDAADDLFIEGGLTAILDAIYTSAKYLDENAKTGARQKFLVLITDGEDRASRMKIEEVIEFLKEKQIKVFALAIADEKVSQKVLDKLTKETGGKKFAPKTKAEIEAATRELVAALRAL